MKVILHQQILHHTGGDMSRYSKPLQKLKRVYDKIEKFLKSELDSDKPHNDAAKAHHKKMEKELVTTDQELADKMLKELKVSDPKTYQKIVSPKEPATSKKEEKSSSKGVKDYTLQSIQGGGYAISEQFMDGEIQLTKLSKRTMDWINQNGGSFTNIGLKKVLHYQRGEKIPEKTDEQILGELKKINRTKQLGKRFLRDMGIKTPIKGNLITIGKYTLKRVSFWQLIYDLH